MTDHYPSRSDNTGDGHDHQPRAALTAATFSVIDRSAELLVLHKPSGVSVLADRVGAPCLWEQLKARFPNARLAHRIDKGTSGLLLAALTPACQRQLTQAFQRGRIRKHYLAVVCGRVPGGGSLNISLPLGRGRKNRYRVAGLREQIRSTPQGWRLEEHPSGKAPWPPAKPALASRTRIRLLAESSRRCLLAVQPTTGRTHQIRVHLAWIGHAVVGDALYGRPDADEQRAPRLALHAHRLVVPGHGVFRAPPDAAFAQLL